MNYHYEFPFKTRVSVKKDFANSTAVLAILKSIFTIQGEMVGAYSM